MQKPQREYPILLKTCLGSFSFEDINPKIEMLCDALMVISIARGIGRSRYSITAMDGEGGPLDSQLSFGAFMALVDALAARDGLYGWQREIILDTQKTLKDMIFTIHGVRI